jgi:hypothetical protein
VTSLQPGAADDSSVPVLAAVDVRARLRGIIVRAAQTDAMPARARAKCVWALHVLLLHELSLATVRCVCPCQLVAAGTRSRTGPCSVEEVDSMLHTLLECACTADEATARAASETLGALSSSAARLAPFMPQDCMSFFLSELCQAAIRVLRERARRRPKGACGPATPGSPSL